MAPKITSKGGDQDLNRGDDFTLECKATGTPILVVVWKRNGERDPRQEVMLCDSDFHLISPCYEEKKVSQQRLGSEMVQCKVLKTSHSQRSRYFKLTI